MTSKQLVHYRNEIVNELKHSSVSAKQIFDLLPTSSQENILRLINETKEEEYVHVCVNRKGTTCLKTDKYKVSDIYFLKDRTSVTEVDRAIREHKLGAPNKGLSWADYPAALAVWSTSKSLLYLLIKVGPSYIGVGHVEEPTGKEVTEKMKVWKENYVPS